MPHNYCIEGDLYRYCPEIAGYLNPARTIIAWAVESGSQYVAFGSGAVSVLFADGEDRGGAEASKSAVDANGEWYYDSATDALYYYNDAESPNNMDMQASEDRATYVTAMLQNASRLIDSMLDVKKQVPVLPNKSGTYDEVMIQATAYKVAEVVTFGRNDDLNERYRTILTNDDKTGIVDMLNDGRIQLEAEKDYDASRGEIKQVAVSGDLNIIRTRGEWGGRINDTLKVLITKAGIIGTAEFTSYEFDDASNLPKNLAMVSAEIIDGNLQHIGGGIYVQFAGSTAAKAATLNDEWEIEVWSSEEEVSDPIPTAAAVLV